MRTISAASLALVIALPLITSCDRAGPISSSPAAQPDTYSIAAGMTLQRSAPGVLANDSMSGDDVVVHLATQAKYGKVILEEDGSFTYTPTYKFMGIDSFAYQLVNGDYVSEPVPVQITFPNVITILVDDLGLGDIGAYDRNAAVDTPNINAFADAGISFSHAHSAAAVCSPSRYSVLTGNYPYRGRLSSGIWDTYEPSTMIVPGQATLADIFEGSGYRTGFVGKLHNGGAFWNVAGTDYTVSDEEIDFARSFDRGPTQFGFDYSFLLPSGGSGRPYAYFENDRLVRFSEATGAYETFSSAEEAGRHLVKLENSWGEIHNGGVVGVSTWAMDNFDNRKSGAILTRKALEFIGRALDESNASLAPRPFFLFFAPPQIHVPYAPPEYFNVTQTNDAVPATEGTRVAGTAETDRIEAIREVDLMVGAIVDFLEARGQLENTLIVFSSDNGPVIWPEAENRYPPGAENGIPLRGLKGNIYEGGHRVPLLARWGDGTQAQSAIAPGSKSAETLGLQDLAATFYALLGQQRPLNQANDSKSVLPILLGTQSAQVPLREHLITQGSPFDYGNSNLIDRAYYRRDAEGDLWKLSVVSSNSDPLAELTWKELYNLSNDSGEATDLIGDPAHKSLLGQMQSEYTALIAQPQTIVSFR